MGGVVVQLSGGGSYFVIYQMGDIFINFFSLCIRENFEKRLKKCCRIQIR